MQTSWLMRLTTVLVLMAASARAAESGTDPAGDAIKLFADEGWYKQQPGKELVFRGKLEAVQPPQASSLMRNARYRLADRAVYTGGQKVSALDNLVGSVIEVRGKAVDMHLEGQEIKEIWPASAQAVKRAPDLPKPAK